MATYLASLMTVLQPMNLIMLWVCAVIGCILGAIPGLSGGLGITSVSYTHLDVYKRQAYESACLSYQSLQIKQMAGMLSNTEYLQGEASYLEKKAARDVAGMTLYQAYETYQWEVKGI